MRNKKNGLIAEKKGMKPLHLVGKNQFLRKSLSPSKIVTSNKPKKPIDSLPTPTGDGPMHPYDHLHHLYKLPKHRQIIFSNDTYKSAAEAPTISS